MSFGNPSELFLLARICFVRLMVFSISACLVFVASSERKIGLLPSMAIHISVTTSDACAADHVVRFTRPSPSVFAYCKRSKTGAGEGLGTRLGVTCESYLVESRRPLWFRSSQANLCRALIHRHSLLAAVLCSTLIISLRLGSRHGTPFPHLSSPCYVGPHCSAVRILYGM